MYVCVCVYVSSYVYMYVHLRGCVCIYVYVCARVPGIHNCKKPLVFFLFSFAIKKSSRFYFRFYSEIAVFFSFYFEFVYLASLNKHFFPGPVRRSIKKLREVKDWQNLETKNKHIRFNNIYVSPNNKDCIAMYKKMTFSRNTKAHGILYIYCNINNIIIQFLWGFIRKLTFA